MVWNNGLSHWPPSQFLVILAQATTIAVLWDLQALLTLSLKPLSLFPSTLDHSALIHHLFSPFFG